MSHATHNSLFWIEAFPGNHLQWYKQLKINKHKCKAQIETTKQTKKVRKTRKPLKIP